MIKNQLPVPEDNPLKFKNVSSEFEYETFVTSNAKLF